MKTTFGFSSVQSGQRGTVVAPIVIANSTSGGFTLTPAVTRALGLQSGDYLQFINNTAEIDAAIASKHEVIVAFCEEKGLDIESPESYTAIHKEFDVWGIAKGIKAMNAKGGVMKCKERLMPADRLAKVTENFDEYLAQALASENEELVAALSRADITAEEQKQILSNFVEGAEVDKYMGCKLASQNGAGGTGLKLTCTDNNVWKQLKSDLKSPETINRVFDVDVEDVQVIAISNGYEEVSVKMIVLGEFEDKTPARKGAQSTEVADSADVQDETSLDEE